MTQPEEGPAGDARVGVTLNQVRSSHYYAGLDIIITSLRWSFVTRSHQRTFDYLRETREAQGLRRCRGALHEAWEAGPAPTFRGPGRPLAFMWLYAVEYQQR